MEKMGVSNMKVEEVICVLMDSGGLEVVFGEGGQDTDRP